jgi:hypothetical protein
LCLSDEHVTCHVYVLVCLSEVFYNFCLELRTRNIHAYSLLIHSFLNQNIHKRYLEYHAFVYDRRIKIINPRIAYNIVIDSYYLEAPSFTLAFISLYLALPIASNVASS